MALINTNKRYLKPVYVTAAMLGIAAFGVSGFMLAPVMGESIKDAVALKQCQYALRSTNPAAACDHLDPCDALSAVKGGDGSCDKPWPVLPPVAPILPTPGIVPPAPTPSQPPATPPSTPLPLYANPYSPAAAQANAWSLADPRGAQLMRRLAEQPGAEWFGDWHADVRASVHSYVTAAAATGRMPVLVAYNIPQRDCGSYSAGGAAGAATYAAWLRQFALGIGDRPAIVVLEPDALPGMDCLSAADQAVRTQMLAAAVEELKLTTAASVYIDAGHPAWHQPAVMAERLRQAGIARADGFSLNVSNFHTTASNLTYGERVSALVGGKHFVIDTSRNGNGAAGVDAWCNPAGRALGQVPTRTTGHPAADAFLWIKRAGESDGTCGPSLAGIAPPAAGQWWPAYARDLAERAGW